MSDYWFRCPGCGTLGTIDEDQADGRVSIQCEQPGCTYHEAVIVRPHIPATEAVRREVVFSVTPTTERDNP